MSDQEIADLTGVSRVYVSKVASQALAKATAALAELGFSEFELEQIGLEAAHEKSAEVEFRVGPHHSNNQSDEITRIGVDSDCLPSDAFYHAA